MCKYVIYVYTSMCVYVETSLLASRPDHQLQQHEETTQRRHQVISTRYLGQNTYNHKN